MTAIELAASIRDAGFPQAELDRIAREGSFEEVKELNLATGFVYKPLRMRFGKLWAAQRRAIEVAASK